jgi:hypothetical protein
MALQNANLSALGNQSHYKNQGKN